MRRDDYMKIKVVFMGSSEIALKPLKKLIEKYDVVGVVTREDAKVGRKKQLTMTPVKKLALENNIKVLTPANIKLEYEEVIKLSPDVIVTCAYGQIIPKQILDFPKYGCINIHASLLPKYRGGAPIQRAILNGEEYTGITIMYMDEGMDTGDIISMERLKIENNDTLSTLSEKLSVLGANMIDAELPNIINGTNERKKQDNALATFAPIIKKEDELLDFNKTSIEVYNKIRGLNPNPYAYFKMNGKIIKVYESILLDEKSEGPGKINLTKKGLVINCLDKKILLTKIKPEGKKEMSSKDYVNGLNKSLDGSII